MRDSELEYVEHLEEAPMRLMIVSLDASSPHWHEEYEVIFVLRGEVAVCEENRGFVLGEGGVLLINPQRVHSFAKKQSRNICLILQFSPVVIMEIYKCPFAFELPPSVLMSEPRLAVFREQLARMGLLLHNRPDGYQFELKGGLYMFIAYMFKTLKYHPVSDMTNQREFLADFDLIKKYIKTHFRDELDQGKIGRELGMSCSKVYRVLSKTGMTSTNKLINYYRTEHAKHLLSNTKQSISSIAAESGFTSDGSFFRIFKELTGTSPAEYRKTPVKNAQSTTIQGYTYVNVSESIELLRSYIG